MPQDQLQERDAVASNILSDTSEVQHFEVIVHLDHEAELKAI